MVAVCLSRWSQRNRGPKTASEASGVAYIIAWLSFFETEVQILHAVQSLTYQRTIIGYHGCDRGLVEKVLMHREKLKPSANNYDWLGGGIYFWEYGCQRALDWATGIAKRRPQTVKTPAVIGAHIHLGVCFDLLDLRFTEMLGKFYPVFKKTLEAEGVDLPKNEQAHGDDRDLVRRKLDCAMLNWVLPLIEDDLEIKFQTVRGVFQEGEAVYPGSAIQKKSHIQVVVRDSTCILGYFLPEP